MAKGSVRKKGKKWYYRFYVEDASGNLVQKECVGTESKAETEKMLRKAMDDYEKTQFIAKSDNITLGELLDIWAEEELKPGTLSNGTVDVYLGVISRIQKYPIGKRKLKSITASHLQEFVDLICFGGTKYDGTQFNGYSKDYIHNYTAILQSAFRFAVFPKRFITLNPMQYVIIHKQQEQVELFAEENDVDINDSSILSHEQYNTLIDYVKEHNPDAVLPIQIAYYTGLRLGELCALSWNDINLDEQYMVIRRSIKKNSKRKLIEFDATKRKKIRIVDFGDTLTKILKKAKKEQHKQLLQYGELYKLNYYQEVTENKRIHYDWHELGKNELPPDRKSMSLQNPAEKMQRDVRNLPFFKLLEELINNNLPTAELNKLVKEEVLSSDICVMSPNNEEIQLPSGSNPIDYAYKIHSDLGNYITAAIVNGERVSLDYTLKDGDIIEIIHNKDLVGPRIDLSQYEMKDYARRKYREHIRKHS